MKLMVSRAVPFGTDPLLALVFAAFLLDPVGAFAASVGPGGYTNDFRALPPAADWATLNIAGGGADSYTADAEVNATVSASGVVAQTVADPGDPPAANVNATWSSGSFYLQTRPTGNRATLLMGKFVNNTGTNATRIALSYLFTIAAGPVSEEIGKGTRVYFSMAGTPNSWTNVTALNTTAGNGGSSVSNASITLNWTNGGNLYLVWFDDNSTSGTDVANQYDNFSLRVTAGTPTNFFCQVSPGDGATVRSGTLLATALTANGTEPYSVEYFTNSGVDNLVFASAGTSGTAPYLVNLGILPAGAYRIYAVSTDSAGTPLSATSATNAFSVANPIVLTLTDPSNAATFAHTNPVLAAATVSGGTAPYSVQFYFDNAPSGAAVTSPPYARNLGGLPVGDHTIRASVTDASGWTSNSAASTVHITGPLAVSLAPPNGLVMTHGTSLSLTAAVAGGEAPYTTTFFVNAQAAGSVSSPPFVKNLGVLPVGSYTCFVHATDSSLPTQQARSSTNQITIQPAPLGIMPLGDSITLGLSVAGGYRAPLYQLLTNAGQPVNFIGTQTGNGVASLPDSDHEGYSGFTIRGIDSVITGTFRLVAPPDIILVLLGVNDYRASDDIAHATNRLEALVVRMTTNWPNAKIIVASLTQTTEPFNTQFQTTYNPLLPGMCERLRAQGRQVYFTDMYSVVPLADMPDQLHPGQLGYNKMATNWFAAINALPCDGCPPRFSLQPKGQSMLPGTNVSLAAAALGTADAIRYQWRLEGTNIPNATNTTYNFTNASLAHQGSYTVAATDTNGTTISSNAFVYLLVRPFFVLNPVPQTVLQGDTVTFSVIATGAPPIAYRWQRGNSFLATNDTGVLTLTNVQASALVRAWATNYASGVLGVPSAAVALTVLADFDQDRMADVWEAQHGFDTNNNADASLDFDQDTMNNLAEYIAGTDPTNADSVLKLSFASKNPALLEFIAQSNRTYTIQYRTNLVSSPWHNLTNLSAQPQARTVQMNAAPPPPHQERYYRVLTPQVP